MFEGIYTPIVTPFNDNEEIDYEKMYHNLDRWGKTDLAGIVILGSNGEFVFMSVDEKLTLVKDLIGRFNKDKRVIVGTGCESTKETIELSKKVAELGADAVLVLPPHYYKGAMKDEILYRHYIDIGDESPVPVFVYNMPGNTGINLPSSLVARLSKHPNIVGIKDTSGSIVQLSELVRDTQDDFAVFPGNAGYLFPALAIGAKGATLALANILPEDCCKLFWLFKDGRMDEAQALQLRMLEINALVTIRFGIPALKVAMDMLGYQGGRPRRPLRPLPEETRRLVEDALRRYGALQ
ncbi:MAG: dihydrodipicolinate synthase family protein [Candidatus Hodarchaeota archaeon]|jgi:4-hydroxy-2-oxoglutarate aldolase